LTVSQITRLFYSQKKDGSPARKHPRQPRPGQIYDRPEGYDTCLQQVRRMVAYGEIEFVPCKLQGKVLTNIQYLVMLKGDRAPSYQNWAHEIARGEYYVAFHRTGRVAMWRTKWHKDEWEDIGKKHKIRFDNLMELTDCPYLFFIEVDMGTEFWSDELEEKIINYAGLADSMPQVPFYVLFPLQVKAGMSIKERAKAFNRKFAAHGRGHSFMIAPHEFLVKDPFGPVWDDYRSNEPVSLAELPAPHVTRSLYTRATNV
jgi:hypothetical protein